MALGIALAMTGAAIALLAVYGADVAAGLGNDGEGFIPFDHRARGIGLGLPSLVLPFAAYFVAKRDPSKALGGMIIAAGALIIIGGAVVLGNAPPDAAESGRSAVSESAPLLAAGAAQIGLGAVKVKRS